MKSVFKKRNLFAPLLSHKCAVYTTSTKYESGKSATIQRVLQAENLSCRVSGAMGSAPAAKGESASHGNSVRVFFEAGLVLRPGDLLEVTALGEKQQLEVVFVSHYETHVEAVTRSLWEG